MVPILLYHFYLHICSFALFALEDHLWGHVGDGPIVVPLQVGLTLTELGGEAKVRHLDGWVGCINLLHQMDGPQKQTRPISFPFTIRNEHQSNKILLMNLTQSSADCHLCSKASGLESITL